MLSVRTCRSGAFLAVLLLQIAEQILLVHAVGDEPGKAVNDGLLVLGVGDAEPLVVGGQHLDADLVGVQQFINVDGQQVLGLQRVGGAAFSKNSTKPDSSSSTNSGVSAHMFIETRLSMSMLLPPAAAPSAVFSMPPVSSTPVR